MNWQTTCLALAGVVGSGVAVVHGILTQRLMVRPVGALLAADPRTSGTIRRIVPMLLHFSTFVWFAGGLALVAVAALSDRETQLTTGLLVGGTYLFGAAGNLWGTRGRHPGWMLLAVSLVLIAIGLADG